MTKFENVLKQIGIFGYPLALKIERHFYQWKHTGNMCKHLIEKGRSCIGCDRDEYLTEIFFNDHLDGSYLFHPYCEECDNMKAERTTNEHCHHLNSRKWECDECAKEVEFEFSLLDDPEKLEAYRLKLVRKRKGFECQEICDDCGSVSNVFIRS